MSDRQSLTAEVVSNKVTGYVVSPEDGEKFEATFKDLTQSEQKELEELEQKADEGDEEAATELQRKVVNDYLLNDMEFEDTGIAWRQSIMAGFLRALGDNEAMREAQEFFEGVEGNQ